MLRGDDIRTVPSILDRLIDDPDNAAVDRYYGLRELKRSVARDLEALLNARQEAIAELSGDFVETSHSLLTYGLPDFSAVNLSNHTDRMRVRRMLEEAIAESEPRLERVRVTVEEARRFDRGLRFRIEAVLRMEPTPEPVTFDAVLQVTTQQCRVDGQT